MAASSPIDWQAVEREYRAGQLSNREIARQYGCSERAIRNRAAAKGWERDLSKKVRQTVRSRMVRADVPATDVGDIVDLAARRGVEVIRSHRAGLQRLTSNLSLLEERFEGILPELVALGPLEKATSILESMTRTRANIIKLERQAFDLDDQPEVAPAANQRETMALIIAEVDAIFADAHPMAVVG